jgi:HD-GYP domain-containing protein (c-di-GMP phosphodiesterase class II)
VWALRTVSPGGSVRARLDRLLAIKAEGEVTRALMRARCDRGAEIAYLLGFGAPTAEAIRGLDEHWDGRGQPHGLRGTEIPLLARILSLAQTTEIFHAAGGIDAAWTVAHRRSGGWFDPDLVAAFGTMRFDVAFWRSVADGEIGDWEPPERTLVADEARLDAIAYAFAGVIDAKSPWTYRHSDRACVIVLGLAAALGADDDELSGLRRAALLHDVGKLAVSNRILDKPGALTAAEFAQIREHPLVTRRILDRIPGFGALAPVAAAHHERLDGTGYPLGLTADALTMPMRLLAVADVYEALTSERPYRAAMRSEQALAIIRVESPHALDQEAAAALATLAHDPGAPTGLGGAHPEDDAARVEEVLDRERAPVMPHDP